MHNFPRAGLRPTDLPRKFPRYRSRPVGAGGQALPREIPTRDQTLDAGRCQKHFRIKKFYGNSENAVKSQIWIAVSVGPRGCRQEAPESGCFTLRFVTDIVGHAVREDDLAASVSGQRLRNHRRRSVQPTESIRLLTGQQ